MKLRFKKLGCNNVNMFYAATNEEPSVFHRFLQDVIVNRAAGISGAGEIGFFCLLPRVEKELVLVDHCAASMAYAMAKWFYIRDLGAKKAYKKLSGGEFNINDYVKELPAFIKGSWLPDSPSYASTIQRVWKHKLSVKDVEQAAEKLHLVRFIHGDLTKLPTGRWPYDLLYVSNALEYTNQYRVQMTAKDIEHLVKPGGLILASSRDGLTALESQAREQKGLWHHQLFRNKEKLAPVTV